MNEDENGLNLSNLTLGLLILLFAVIWFVVAVLTVYLNS